MATKKVGVVRKRVDMRKLHRELGEVSDLRIHQLIRYPDRKHARCIVDATKPKTVAARMKNNGLNTNGRPISNAYWLINVKSQEVYGPCGSECGSRAVMNSWLKPRRAAMRQQLLARGVPASEVDDRLEQLAHYEWLKMLRVYRKAEKEAEKLGINTTSMTFDEVIAAVSAEKERLAFEAKLQEAVDEGLAVTMTTKPPIVEGVKCSTSEEVEAQIKLYLEKQAAIAKAAAQARVQALRQQYQDYVEFIDWFLQTTSPGNANANSTNYSERRRIESAEYYIENGTPYQRTLDFIESVARQARAWPDPWTGKLGPSQPGPVAGQNAAPPCPKCGGILKRRSGYSKRARRNYDFYGCKNFPNCDGSMEVKDYEKHMNINQPGQTAPPSSPPNLTAPKPTAHAAAPPAGVSKAVAAAQAQTKRNQTLNQTAKPGTKEKLKKALEEAQQEEEEKPSAKKAMKKRKRKGYWAK